MLWIAEKIQSLNPKTGRFYGVKGLYAMGDYAKKYKFYA
ncbi:hypothetical protein XBKQ1_850008 [Xenorhabdus bovienii str. kraussei Quebec]|uniref:Uncharacterized protein n=2 Tax=Xenorhabdus bovienii TaxID=40576 RepID=A0A077PMI8_XENBV|nr:hypothetical protein XBFFL1_1440013 [Xenorhabdus bovienii str. feltiae Florida]CDH21946.1 hypothetical protein XBKQ1_850008 [Xenorhabdus bovienii str. kraussei Quebec]CDH31079.1 hypothetical protein XBI1_1260100 [Xenorhabdus bovienii str. Intermedium]